MSLAAATATQTPVITSLNFRLGKITNIIARASENTLAFAGRRQNIKKNIFGAVIVQEGIWEYDHESVNFGEFLNWHTFMAFFDPKGPAGNEVTYIGEIDKYSIYVHTHEDCQTFSYFFVENNKIVDVIMEYNLPQRFAVYACANDSCLIHSREHDVGLYLAVRK